jgi:hypothetical protein
MQLTVQNALRQRELAQWSEILTAVPSLIDGYDFTRITYMLRDMRFESPEVQSALDGQRYLYSQATAFLTRLFSDLQTQGGFSGLLLRRSGSAVQGKLSSATMETASITLDRGVITLQLADLAPQTLLDAAQYFASVTTDSTEYYLRQEEIATFARAAGLPGLSATVAAQLMEENRSFRQRWLKVAQ